MTRSIATTRTQEAGMKLPISAQLWRLLANPPYTHPLYRRNAIPRVGPEWLHGILRVINTTAPVLYLPVTAFFCCSITSGQTGLMLGVLAVGVLLFNGTLYGLGWSMGIAGELSSERERNAYELLCLLPSGALGVVWAIAAGTMHRENNIRKRADRHLLILIGLLVFALVLSLSAVFNRAGVVDGEIVAMYAAILGVAAAIYIDYRQSVVISALVGVFAGQFTARRFDAELWALLVFLTLQLVIYACAVVAGFVVLPALVDAAGAAGWQRDLLLVALRVLALVGTREVVISLAWRLLAERLNVPTGQIDTLLVTTKETRYSVHHQPSPVEGS